MFVLLVLYLMVCDTLCRLRLFLLNSGLDFVYGSLRLFCGFVCRLVLLVVPFGSCVWAFSGYAVLLAEWCLCIGFVLLLT